MATSPCRWFLCPWLEFDPPVLTHDLNPIFLFLSFLYERQFYIPFGLRWSFISSSSSFVIRLFQIDFITSLILLFGPIHVHSMSCCAFPPVFGLFDPSHLTNGPFLIRPLRYTHFVISTFQCSLFFIRFCPPLPLTFLRTPFFFCC